MPEWVIAIISVVIGTLLGFGLNLLRDKQQKRDERRQEALKIHFNDIETSIMEKISLMARSLCIQNNRIVFGGYTPVKEKYDFEEEEEYQAFKIHFPEHAHEWNELNNKTIELSNKLKIFLTNNTDEKSYIAAREGLKPLQDDFSNYARSLTNTSKNIQRYEIGTVFKHNRNCPICKKF